MLKTIIIGVWSCVVALAAAYMGLLLGQSQDSKPGSAPESEKMTHVAGRQISVPIATNGEVKGYVVAKIGYVARASDLTRLEIKPDVFLFDAAFSAIFSGDGLNIDAINQKSLAEFSRRVKEKMNGHLGAETIREVITEEMAYLPFEQIRGRSRPSAANRTLPGMVN